MIKIPRLSENDLRELNDLKDHDGYKIIIQSVDRTIRENDITLHNWDFEFYDKNEEADDGVRKFRDLQKTNSLLKSLIQFLDVCNMTSINSNDPKEKAGVYE